MAAAAKRALVSGASGLIGSALLTALKAEGYGIVILTRRPSGAGQIKWDPAQPLAPEAVSGFDAVIHLAGESIARRWTAARKRRILESRAAGTRHLAQALAKADSRPRVFVSASAIGYYGSRGDELLREDSSSGNDFLSEVCRQWEAATKPAADAGIRSVQTRFGLVLSKSGGALPKMLTPFRLGLGGSVGNGRQWWSWIDIHDLVAAILHVMHTDSIGGPVNFTAPNPVTNFEFTRTLARVLRRPAVFPMPAFAARLIFGEMADQLLLASQKVEPSKLLASGFQFNYPSLNSALEHRLRS